MTAFYRGRIGLVVIRQVTLDGELATQVTGFAEARVKIVFLARPGGTHLLELVRYLRPPGNDGHTQRNSAGAAHLCFTVDDLDAVYAALSSAGVRFSGAPATVGDVKAVMAQDPEGNWLDFIQQSS